MRKFIHQFKTRTKLVLEVNDKDSSLYFLTSGPDVYPDFDMGELIDLIEHHSKKEPDIACAIADKFFNA